MAFPNNLKPWFDRGAGIVRGTVRRTGRMAGSGIIRAGGLVARARHLRPAPKPGMTDETLARKVESIVFRPAGAPKGKVDINVVDGIVHLHGELKTPRDITAMVSAVQSIPEVKGVKNDLHLPKTKAPSTAGGTRRQRKTTTTPRTTGRFSREVKSAKAESSPTELASARAGRRAAPMGSKEPAAETPGEKVEETLAAAPTTGGTRAGGTKTGRSTRTSGGTEGTKGGAS